MEEGTLSCGMRSSGGRGEDRLLEVEDSCRRRQALGGSDWLMGEESVSRRRRQASGRRRRRYLLRGEGTLKEGPGFWKRRRQAIGGGWKLVMLDY